MQTFVIVMTILQVAAFVVLTRHMLAELAKARKNGGMDKREARLIELYGHVEELMDVFEAYVDEVREDVEKERAALTELSRQAAVMFMRAESGELKVESEGRMPNAQQPAPHDAQRPSAPRVVRPASVPASPSSQLSILHSQLPSRLPAGDKEALGRFATKPQKVRFLMGRGLALEEVARELGVGTGEVRLIAELER